MPVEKKPMKRDMSSNTILKYLRTFNNFLEQVPIAIYKFLDKAFKSETGLTQKGVDMICEWAAWRVNVIIETGRQEFIKSLYDQNSIINKILAPIRAVKKIFEDPLSILGAVASAVKQIANIFLGPLSFIISFTQELIKELERLAKNLAAVASMTPPPPPSQDLNLDKFQLKIGTMGMSTILDDPSNLPPPEEMFGEEPPVPFSPEYFQELGAEAKTIWREDKPFFKMKEDDSENN